MIEPIPPAAPETRDRQPSQGKPRTKPARPSQEADESHEFEDIVQLSPEALSAAHGNLDYEGA
jgi:hypothetical protein